MIVSNESGFFARWNVGGTDAGFRQVYLFTG
jgi:hypothetical protein